jgi:peptide deformylase
MRIIEYPHPTLRHRAKPLKRVDEELRAAVEEMFRLMYAAKGVGLAANQVDLPYRLFIMNPESDESKRDLEMVFINPTLSRLKGQEEAEEGCLSLPGLYGQVVRAERVSIHGYSLEGREQALDLSGFPAKIVQHETDHLDGVLFIDRLSPTGLAALKDELSDFEVAFRSKRQLGEIPSDEAIMDRLARLETERC